MTHNQQHTYGSKCSYLNSPFVQKTWNARKKRCVTGSAENVFSLRTAFRRLKNAGLRSRRPVQKQVLNKRLIADRLAWATRHRRQTQMQWSRIILSAKKCFHVDKKDGRIRCFRRQNERFQRPNIHQYGPRQSIMVWAAISAEGKSEIMRFH